MLDMVVNQPVAANQVEEGESHKAESDRCKPQCSAVAAEPDGRQWMEEKA